MIEKRHHKGKNYFVIFIKLFNSNNYNYNNPQVTFWKNHN